MKYQFRDEATYAADMRRLCILEGHKPGLPQSSKPEVHRYNQMSDAKRQEIAQAVLAGIGHKEIRRTLKCGHEVLAQIKQEMSA